jgi:transcriptional regulator with XRE-family HTH domain
LGGVQTAILSQSDHQRAAGDRLRRLIKLLGISYVEAAETMNVSKHVLNHWMSGNHPIQPYPLYRLCRSKGVNFDYVFLGDWSSLPHRMGREIEAEILPSRETASASDRKDA